MTVGILSRLMQWGSAVALVFMICFAGVAFAADFDVDSDDWHGLADFVDMAEEQDVVLITEDSLDWGDVKAEDVVFIIYPAQELDVDSLSSFLIDGGRVVLADDFGSSQEFLSRLNVLRTEPTPEELSHNTFVDDHRGWPVLTPSGRHPLLEDVEEIVANYPAVFHNTGGPVISYDDDGGFAYDMTLGDGRAILVADPGVFINAMLPAADNRQFAANIWEYLCDGVEECTAWLLVESFDTEGAYGDGASEGITGDSLGEGIEALNDRLREIFEELPGSDLLYFIGLFLVAGTVAYLAVVFPWRRAQELSSYIDRHREDVSPPVTEFDWNVARFSNPQGRINYTLPTAILKESFLEAFLSEFDLRLDEPQNWPTPDLFARRFDERYLRGQDRQTREEQQRDVEQLLDRLMSIPSRDQVFLESDEYISAREMERLHGRIIRVLSWMGLQESYERRTGEIKVRNRRNRR